MKIILNLNFPEILQLRQSLQNDWIDNDATNKKTIESIIDKLEIASQLKTD